MRQPLSGHRGGASLLGGWCTLLLALACLVRPLSAADLTGAEEEWLRENGRLRFISQIEYPPFEFVGETGESTGMSVELARWICDEYGIEAEFRNATFAEAQQAVLDGEADVITSFFYSQRRDQSFDFSSVVYDVPALIFVRRAQGNISGANDLAGRRVAMQEGDYAREYLAEQGIRYERVTTESFALAADVVIAGGAEALIGDKQIVLYHLASSDQAHELKTVGEPLYIGRNCMGVADGNRMLASILTKGIEQARREGVLDEISARWIGPESERRRSWLTENARAVLILLLALGIVLAFVAVWSAMLRRQVAQRTNELKRSRKFLGEALRIARIARWEYDSGDGTIRLDAYAQRLLGLEKGHGGSLSMPLSGFEDRFVRESAPVSTAAALDELRDETGDEPERRLRQRIARADGTERTFAAILRRTNGNDGAEYVYSGTIQDITEIDEAERALAASERRLQLALKGSKMAFWDYDATTETFATDERWLRMLGYQPNETELEIDSISSRIHEDDQEHVRSAFARHLAGQAETYLVECRYRMKDGSWLWVQSTGSVVERGENGAPTRISGTYQDISERKRHDRERAELDARLEEVARLESLSVLAGGIAHDFNNLLVGVLGSAGLALSELPAESTARSQIELIEKTARQASDLTKQMLAYSGKGRFVVAPVSLSRLVREMLHLLESATDGKATLRLDLDDSIPAVEGDVTQLRQVVMNLMINASDALQDREGLITIRAGTIDVDEQYLLGTRFVGGCRPGRYVFLEVSDTGVGMSPGVQEKIFDPFFTTKTTGHGLGLAAVLGIIRGHGGFLKVYSEKGKGTTFKVGLPASEKPDRIPRPQTAEPAAGMSGTVLVIDDHATVRNVAARMLERLGFETLEADGGRAGIDTYFRNEEAVRLVLLDMSMPDMTGDEVFAELRRRNARVPILLMSGFNEQDATNRFVGKGLAGFLQKPFTLADMRAVVNEVLVDDPPADT